MAIVRHLVELHGGTVRAESEGENRGARFTAQLPVSMPVRLEHTQSVPGDEYDRQTVQGLLPQLAGLRVLIVDDETDSSSFLCKLLEDHGADVDSAASAAEAFDTFIRSRPDILISDLAMPGEDGFDLIRRVRKLGARKGGRTPAVALTAYVRTEDADRALAAGYQRHLRKPVNVVELLTAVTELAAGQPTRTV
jgi:CheY-like chemotaxis protein